MSERPRNEKEEKEEKEREESWDEKWRRDPVNAVVWAFILIWAGVVFLAENAGLLLGLGVEAWALGFMGAGVIVLVAALVRLVLPAYRRPLMGSLILGVVLLGIGLGQVVGWVAIGPLILIAIGVGILLRGLSRGR